MNKKVLLLFIPVLMFKCGTMRPWYAREVREWEKAISPDTSMILHTVYLMGDAGDPERNRQEPSLKLLEKMILEGKQENTSVLWLGDNIYQAGLPPTSSLIRREAERRINQQLNTVKEFKGNIVFIPGNHDWDHSGPDGLESVLRQERYIEEFLQKEDIVLPGGGCPGPYVKHLNNKLVLVVIDSEWWLHKHSRPYGISSPCDVEDELDLIVQLEDVLNTYSNKNILIALHHPLFSNGNHGGHYSLKDHIFPLTLVNDKMYIPIPLIGSIYPFGRMYGISRQDIANEKYQLLKNSLLTLLSARRNVVLAAGHEHSLQLHPYREVFQIVSGSVTKDTYVIRGNGAEFVYNQKGFAKVNYYSNNEVWVEFWVPEKDGSTGKIVFRKPLYAFQLPDKRPGKEPGSNYIDSIIVEAIQPSYYTNSIIKKFFLGGHYRKEWSTPVTFRYLDMDKENGGLTPIKMGGGKQTVTLRLKGGDGNEYVLRSLDKNPAALLPEGFKRTFAEELIRDQMSASHPYGALVIPRLSKAVGVLTTNPTYRFVPYTPSLGPYLGKFAGVKVLKEWRPNENAINRNSQKIVGTEKMLENIFEDNDNKVDAFAFARARLLDMLIGDWDRHEDQWRWVVRESPKGNTYIPFPRDRDQVFAKYDGLIPTIMTSNIGRREVQSFSPKIKDVMGINKSGKNLDRAILTMLTRQQWKMLADSMQKELTDEVIFKAVNDMPPEIVSISGDEIISKLKSRRNDLKRVAERYYEILNNKVDIFLSDKHEYVNVERHKDSTRLVVYKIKKTQDELLKLLYERTFYQRETDEIRVYCRAGNDSIVINGDAPDGILLRIVPGEGDDVVIDRSSVRGRGKMTRIYIQKDSALTLTESKETQIFESVIPEPEYVGFREFKYNHGSPSMMAEYNPDYHLLMGIGATYTTYGFRKTPFQSMHTLKFAHSSRTQADYLDYKGSFPQSIRNFELLAHFSLTGSRNQINYFGEGNETPFTSHIDHYRLTLRNHEADVQLGYITRNLTLAVGPMVQSFRTGLLNESLTNDTLVQLVNQQHTAYFAGAKVDFNVDYRDNITRPRKGLAFLNTYWYKDNTKSRDFTYHKFRSELQFYLTPNLPFLTTLGLRFGGERNFGQFPFYESCFLGNSTNLRGFYNNRFAGRSAVYQNTEIRINISRLQSIAINGNWGLNTFIDHGKVWSGDTQSSTFHRGYGGGIWLDFFNLSVISGNVGFSKEGSYFQFNFGYYF